MDERDRIRELLTSFDTAALITHSDDNFHARPMALGDVDEACELWFVTSEGSVKTQEIRDDARVQVICQNGWTSFVTVTGRATLLRDSSRVRELWKASYKVWFPKGPDDPEIVVIRVRPEFGEYWDNRGQNAIRYAFESVKALATGTRPQVGDKEQHGQTNLQAGNPRLAGTPR